jgi:hypothetical protein
MCVATVLLNKILQTQVRAAVLGQKQTGAWDLKGQGNDKNNAKDKCSLSDKARKGHKQNNNKDKDLKIGKNFEITRTWEQGQRRGSDRDAGTVTRTRKKDTGKGKEQITGIRARKRTIRRRRTQTRNMTSEGQGQRR